MELLECRTQYVVDEHQPRLRRDDDALGTNRAVTDVRHLLVQKRECMNELTNETECGVGLDGEHARFGEGENLRETRSLHVLGDDGERGPGRANPLDAPHAAVMLRLERGQPADAIAQRKLKRGDRGEFLAKRKQLERLVLRTDTQTPLAKSIVKSDGCR